MLKEVKAEVSELFHVGGIITTHGLKGEVRIYPTTEDVHRFSELDELFLEDHKGHLYLVHIASVRYQKGQVLLSFKEFPDINAIEPYKKCQLYVDREHATPLGEGEYYVADLIGLDVVSDDETFRGSLYDVMETGANDVYEIHSDDGKKLLLPAIKQCVLDVDMEAHLMRIHILDGLLDL